MNVPLWAWAAFVLFVLTMLALDVVLLRRRPAEGPAPHAGLWTLIWIGCGLGFGFILLIWRGGDVAGAYLAGYLIEKGLSVDNVFVFALIFSLFGVPRALQHRVLMFGVVGALVMRAGFIAGGGTLLDAFAPTIYVFGALLLYSAFKVIRHGASTVRPDRNVILRLMGRFIPSIDALDGSKFFSRVDGRRVATPLLAVLLVVETTDVIFAIDSIPAIFAVTRDRFVVFTSNVFALLGMRALYFFVAGAAERFRYLQPALGVILASVGLKLMLSDVYHVPVWVSLAFIALVLAVAVVLSVISPGSARDAVPSGPMWLRPRGGFTARAGKAHRLVSAGADTARRPSTTPSP
jgi:tellurite resistance protein TerC